MLFVLSCIGPNTATNKKKVRTHLFCDARNDSCASDTFRLCVVCVADAFSLQFSRNVSLVAYKTPHLIEYYRTGCCNKCVQLALHGKGSASVPTDRWWSSSLARTSGRLYVESRALASHALSPPRGTISLSCVCRSVCGRALWLLLLRWENEKERLVCARPTTARVHVVSLPLSSSVIRGSLATHTTHTSHDTSSHLRALSTEPHPLSLSLFATLVRSVLDVHLCACARVCVRAWRGVPVLVCDCRHGVDDALMRVLVWTCVSLSRVPLRTLDRFICVS